MSTTLTPTKSVRCVYSTVLSSKATRYFAVAPVRRYETRLGTQLTNDVVAMVMANTDDAACCSKLTANDDDGASSSGVATAPVSPPSDACVCLHNVTIQQINRRFADRTSLLGITFEVLFDVYEYDDGTLRPASDSDAEPSVPFLVVLERSKAFPNIVANFFHALTRKGYLSELSFSPDVFAHVTMTELETMLHRTTYTVDLEQLSKTRSILSSPKDTHLNVQTLSDTPVDYCTVLFESPSALPSSYAPVVHFNETNSDGTTVTYSYPSFVFFTAKSYNNFDSAECTGSMCSLGILCGVLMLILILAAGVAYVVQRCRRRRSERSDEKRLLQRQLR